MRRFWYPTIAIFVLAFIANPVHAQWSQISSITGEVVNVFATNGPNLFVGTVYDTTTSGVKTGVFRSTDNGVTWANTNLPTDEPVSALLMNGTNLFAGTGFGDPNNVFLSTNNGVSWAVASSGLPNEPINVLSAIGDDLFAGGGQWPGNGGVYLSTNNGTNWSATTLINHQVLSLAVMGTILFAGTNQYGVYRSTDSGASWTMVNNGFTNKFGPLPALAVVGTSIFVATGTSGVLRSTDSGNSWTRANSGITYSSPDSGVSSLAVSCTNLFAGVDNLGVFRSTDSGASWTAVNNGLTIDPNTFYSLGVNDESLFVAPDNLGVGGSFVNGVWRMPLNWVSLAEQLTSSSFGDTLQATTCVSTNFSFTFQYNSTCSFGTLDTVFIAGLDTNEYQISRTHNSTGANATDTSWVTVNPTKIGINSFTVTAQYLNDSNNIMDTTIILTLNVSPPPTLSINLPPGQLSDTDRGTVSIPVYASSVGTVTGGSVTFRINMRTDLLTPESISTTLPGAGIAPLQVDDSGVWITLTLPPNFSISSDTLIATLVCRAFVTDTNETPITVASSSGTSNCLSILGTGRETFTLTPQCGDPTLMQFLLTGSPFAITSIIPNPAQTSIEVKLSAPSLTPISFTLSDPLGRSYEVRQTGNTLDISSLPSGVYFLSDGVNRAKFVKE